MTKKAPLPISYKFTLVFKVNSQPKAFFFSFLSAHSRILFVAHGVYCSVLFRLSHIALILCFCLHCFVKQHYFHLPMFAICVCFVYFCVFFSLFFSSCITCCFSPYFSLTLALSLSFASLNLDYNDYQRFFFRYNFKLLKFPKSPELLTRAASALLHCTICYLVWFVIG